MTSARCSRAIRLCPLTNYSAIMVMRRLDGSAGELLPTNYIRLLARLTGKSALTSLGVINCTAQAGRPRVRWPQTSKQNSARGTFRTAGRRVKSGRTGLANKRCQMFCSSPTLGSCGSSDQRSRTMKTHTLDSRHIKEEDAGELHKRPTAVMFMVDIPSSCASRKVCIHHFVPTYPRHPLMTASQQTDVYTCGTSTIYFSAY